VNKFLEEIKNEFKRAYNNNEKKEAGKIINNFHYKRICSMMDDHEGEVVFGNANMHNDLNLGFAVIKNPKRDCKLMQEEIFGPLLPMIVYTHLDEAVKYINDGEKPLAIYYFGDRNGANAERICSETSSGSFNINEVIFQLANDYLPFGGVGASGYGRYYGRIGF